MPDANRTAPLPRLAIDARVVDAGGLGRYFRNVVSGVLSKGLFDVTLMGDPARLAKYPWAARTKVVDFQPKLFSPGEQLAFFRSIPACDVFWSPHYNVPLFPLRGKKRLVTIHDGLHFFMWKEISLLQKIYVKLAMNYGAFASEAVITVSEYSRGQILEHVRVKPRRIEVIHNAIEPDFDRGPSEPAPAGPYVLYVGNVKPHKNLKNALLGFKPFAQAHPGFRFLIAGKKDVFLINDREIDSIVETMPQGAVEFLGEVSEAQLKGLYRGARAFIYPSLYEGFGIPILEAMAFDIPVMASRGSSIPEVGDDAIEYFDPRDPASIHACMERVLADGFSPDLAKYSRQREKFSLERCVDRHVEILTALCRDGRRRRPE
jgi:glycosyltransferase involved in cell wall biosynthesis